MTHEAQCWVVSQRRDIAAAVPVASHLHPHLLNARDEMPVADSGRTTASFFLLRQSHETTVPSPPPAAQQKGKAAGKCACQSDGRDTPTPVRGCSVLQGKAAAAAAAAAVNTSWHETDAPVTKEP